MAARITGLPLLRSACGDDLVARRHAGPRVDHEQQRIGLGDGGQGLVGHAAAARRPARFLEAGGVDQAQVQAANTASATLAVAGHARRVMHDGERRARPAG